MSDCSTVGGLRSFLSLKLARYWLKRNQNYSCNFDRTKICQGTFSLQFATIYLPVNFFPIVKYIYNSYSIIVPVYMRHSTPNRPSRDLLLFILLPRNRRASKKKPYARFCIFWKIFWGQNNKKLKMPLLDVISLAGTLKVNSMRQTKFLSYGRKWARPRFGIY